MTPRPTDPTLAPAVLLKAPALGRLGGAASLSSLTEAVGNTPMVRLRRVATLAHIDDTVEIYAKLEFFNPGGSVKDRAALQMVQDALRDGRFRKGQTLIDSTSGNTGVAYSWIGAALGFRVMLVMPSNVSEARKQIASAYGAQIHFSDPLEGSDGAIREVRRLVAAEPERFFYPDQYSNPSNPGAHAEHTAREIWEQTEGRVTHVVAGIGTSGTIMGTSRGLKAFRKEIQSIAVEPAEAMHGLEGLKHMASSIVPAIFQLDALDEKLSIPTDEGWDWAERLQQHEGILVGHSGGAALAGSLRIARRLIEAKEPGVVVTLFPDRADRYFEPRRNKKAYAW